MLWICPSKNGVDFEEVDIIYKLKKTEKSNRLADKDKRMWLESQQPAPEKNA